MGIMDYVRKAKDELQTRHNAAKSKKAWAERYPDEALKEVKEESRRLKVKEEIRQVKRENFKAKFSAISNFVGGATVKKVKTIRKGGATFKERDEAFGIGNSNGGVNPAFGLGASRESYNLNRPSVFGKSKRKKVF